MQEKYNLHQWCRSRNQFLQQIPHGNLAGQSHH